MKAHREFNVCELAIDFCRCAVWLSAGLLVACGGAVNTKNGSDSSATQTAPSNGSNSNDNGSNGSDSASPSSGVLSLSTGSYTVAQNVGTVVVTVTRTAGSTGAVSVGYGTGNSSAVAGSNYTAASGVLNWSSGDTSAKSFTVGINDATPFVGTKSFAVALASPGGGATLGAPSSAVMTIDGNGVAAASSGSAMGQAAAARLLMQGTMGASLKDLSSAAGQSYGAWFAGQAAAPVSLELPQVSVWNADRKPAWWYNAVNGSDQLRQRMAFALSEIFVTSAVNNVTLYARSGAGVLLRSDCDECAGKLSHVARCGIAVARDGRLPDVLAEQPAGSDDECASG